MTPASLALAAPGSVAVGILLQILLARALSARAKGGLAFASCVPALVATLGLVPAVRGGAAVELALGAWDGPLRFVLHVDGLSVLFAAMATGIGLLVLLFSIGYMAEDPAATRFYALMLTFIGGLVGLVFSANLLLVYACWELVGLCSFGLVGFWYRQADAVRGARRVLLMTHLAGYGLLAAVVVLYARTGSALWTDPGVASAFTSGVFLLMLLALIAKSVQFPLHTWIPEAMAAPTPVSALLHAACYVKAGVYLAARMHAFAPWQASWSATVVGVGTVTMLVGALYAMVQGDLKRMLAFSTVSQIGYMITGLGIGTPLGITAGLLHCLNHGFFKGGLFLAAGSVQHATGTREMDQLGGLASRMPRTTLAWLLSAGSMMGFPLMSGFASKWLLYSAALEAGWFVPALAAWVASIATMFYCAKATDAVFLGSPTPRAAKAHESPPTMQWALLAMAAGSIVLGVAPQLPVRFIINPALAALGAPAGVQVTWFGLSGAAGAWWSTVGAVLAIVSILLGLLVFFAAGASRAVVVQGAGAGAGALAGGVFTGGEPLIGDGRLPASDYSLILKHHFAPVFRWVDVDRVYLGAWGALRALAEAAARALRRAEAHAAAWTLGLAAALACAVARLAAAPGDAGAAEIAAVPWVLVAGCAVGCGALCAAALAHPAVRRHAPLMALAGAAAVAGIAARAPLLRLALLEGAAVLAVGLVWRCAASPAARRVFLAVALFSLATLVCGELLLEGGHARWARALLVAGFLVKLGAVPLFLWLPRIAEDLPALALGLVVAVLDMAFFGELWALVRAAPWLVEPRALWLAVALASALGGAALMLAQRDLKRLLALSTVEDLGFLLLGLSCGLADGSAGALWGAVAHAVAKALLFVTLAAPEADGALGSESAGLAGRYPVSSAGFLVGMLAVLGVPPTLGFAGRWRLYGAAQHLGSAALLAFAVASAMALVAYALALTRVWWGPGEGEAGAAAREPALLRVVVIGLCVLLVGAGAWPALLGLVGSVP